LDLKTDLNRAGSHEPRFKPIHGSVNDDVSPRQHPAAAVAFLQKSPSVFQKSTRSPPLFKSIYN
ncbi:hypothetical protein KFY46_25380, partial [Salmonella enterica subsp. enterica serovar 1,4,[5],12:i:-]|nr:hypothetical protein [Salmonella enterica subsp. enterica serovar 1,4,[5],12:i:-]